MEYKLRIQKEALNYMKKITKLLAFTLAETLIVMGIIGVVAALTIPNLNSSTADKEKVAKLKKVYSNLNDAIGRSEAVYGNMSEWQWSNSNGPASSNDAQMFAERIGDFLKTSKTCGLALGAGCLSRTAKWLNGTNWSGTDGVTDNVTGLYKYILADGSSLAIRATSYWLEIYVDIDGPNKGSSTVGKDLFDFWILSPNSSSMGSQIASTQSWQLLTANPNGNTMLIDKTDLSSNFSSGLGLATWVLQNDNMDYLKATNGKCKNNTVLSWTNRSCK